MKKRWIVIGISLLMWGLVGCGIGTDQRIEPVELKPEAIPQEVLEEIGIATPETSLGEIETTVSEAVTEEPETALMELQLRILAEDKDMWAEEPGFADESYQYAVTDLDSNGRYEVIVAGMGGTGMYTYSRFFQISGDGNSLEECGTDFQEGDSQPDLMSGVLDVYLDGNGILHYVVHDLIKNGAAEYYENVRGLTLQEGKIITEPIAYRATIYEAEEPQVHCQDASGNSIEEADYEKAADNYFAQCEKKQASLGWQNVRDLPEDLEGMLEKLRASAKIWSIGE